MKYTKKEIDDAKTIIAENDAERRNISAVTAQITAIKWMSNRICGHDSCELKIISGGDSNNNIESVVFGSKTEEGRIIEAALFNIEKLLHAKLKALVSEDI